MKRITLILMALLLLCMPLTLALAAYDLLYEDEEGSYYYQLQDGYLTFQIQQTDYFTGEPTRRTTMPLPLSESMLAKLRTTSIASMCTFDSYSDYVEITEPDAIDTARVRVSGTVDYVVPYVNDALLVLSYGAGNHSLCVATQGSGGEYHLQQSGSIPAGIEIDTYHAGESGVYIQMEELTWSNPNAWTSEFRRGSDGNWWLVAFQSNEYRIDVEDGVVWCRLSDSDDLIQLTGSMENLSLTRFDFTNIPLTLEAFWSFMNGK